MSLLTWKDHNGDCYTAKAVCSGWLGDMEVASIWHGKETDQPLHRGRYLAIGAPGIINTIADRNFDGNPVWETHGTVDGAKASIEAKVRAFLDKAQLAPVFPGPFDAVF